MTINILIPCLCYLIIFVLPFLINLIFSRLRFWSFLLFLQPERLWLFLYFRFCVLLTSLGFFLLIHFWIFFSFGEISVGLIWIFNYRLLNCLNGLRADWMRGPFDRNAINLSFNVFFYSIFLFIFILTFIRTFSLNTSWSNFIKLFFIIQFINVLKFDTKCLLYFFVVQIVLVDNFSDTRVIL